MALRTALGRAQGLGAAKAGFAGWWMQRVTSVAMVPLMLWFVFSVAALGGMDYPTLLAWVQSPSVAILLILLIVTAYYHMQLGLRVIIEDYVEPEALKVAAIVLMNFACILVMVVGLVAVLKIYLGIGS